MNANAAVDPTQLRDRLVDLGRSQGLAAVGVCDAAPFEDTRRILEQRRADGLSADMAFTYRNPERSTDPSRALSGARSMVVGAYRYDTTLADPPVHAAARVARYATADHYECLRDALAAIAQMLRDQGHRAVVVADDNAMVDRAVAARAGLGWYGKNANVLLPGEGSWFVLGSVITDAVLQPTGEPLADGCGSCARCIEGCPTAAIVAPGVVDARRCLAWHLQATGDFPREFRAALGDRIYGCDECQEVCPPSRRADARTTATTATTAGPAAQPIELSTTGSTRDERQQQRDPGTWVDLHWLLSADDDELLATLGRWYIPRREVRYLRRNALVVLANSGANAPVETDRLLARYLDDEDDLLAAHATWAALCLGRDELLQQPSRQHRPAIMAEVDAHSAYTAGSGDDGGA